MLSGVLQRIAVELIHEELTKTSPKTHIIRVEAKKLLPMTETEVPPRTEAIEGWHRVALTSSVTIIVMAGVKSTPLYENTTDF